MSSHPLSIMFFEAVRRLDVARVRAFLQAAPELAQDRELGLVSPLMAVYERPISDDQTEDQQRTMARGEIDMEVLLLAHGAVVRDPSRPAPGSQMGRWSLLANHLHECFNRLNEGISEVGDQARRFSAWLNHVPEKDRTEALRVVIHQWHRALCARSPLGPEDTDLGIRLLNQVETFRPPVGVYQTCEEDPMRTWVAERLMARDRARQAEQARPTAPRSSRRRT